MVEFLAEKGLTRKDLVVALGGGVCGDMAGFAAAIYLRGIDFVGIPTTLLSQVDSSVGGKTGVDLPQGRIFAVRFISPYWCLLIRWLCTRFPIITSVMEWVRLLRRAVSKVGTAFEKIENKDVKENIEEIIFECVDIKRGVVERDEKSRVKEHLLNFGSYNRSRY